MKPIFLAMMGFRPSWLATSRKSAGESAVGATRRLLRWNMPRPSILNMGRPLRPPGVIIARIGCNAHAAGLVPVPPQDFHGWPCYAAVRPQGRGCTDVCCARGFVVVVSRALAFRLVRRPRPRWAPWKRLLCRPLSTARQRHLAAVAGCIPYGGLSAIGRYVIGQRHHAHDGLLGV